MTIEAALDLAAAGLPVFPCGRDKRPLVPHWRQDATTDAARIREWWRAHPVAMAGLPCGEASGLYVVDLDVDKSTGEALGESTLAALGLSYLLEGPRVNTPSGGVHLFYRWPGEGFGNTAKRLGPGIDTRGEGGFVIAAGSCNGVGEYVPQGDWQNPPELPEALHERLNRTNSTPPPANAAPAAAWGAAALQGELSRLQFATEGERNDALNLAAFRAGQVVAGGCLDRATAAAELEAVAQELGLPPQETRRTIESGMTAGMKAPRGPVAQPGGPSETPQPLLREIPPGAPYPVEALGSLRAAVEAVAGETLAPVAIPAASALAVASLAVQGFADVETLAGLRPVSLYALTVAKSGERKSSCDTLLMAGLRSFEKEAAAEYAKAMQSWNNRYALWKGDRDKALADAKSTKAKDKRTAAEADLEALQEPAAPPSPDRTVTEPTHEGLTRKFSEGMPSLGLFSDEGGQFLGGHAMNADNRQKTLAALNGLWDGAPIRRTRQGDGHFVLYGRRLALHLMVQPGVANSFLSDAMAADIGFLPRCLLCDPASTVGWRTHDRMTFDRMSLDAFADRLRDILQTPLPMEEETRTLQPRELPLSPDARARLIRFSDEVEVAQRPGGRYADLTGTASKAAEQACRIAGVLTLWGDLHAPVVTGETMADAITLAQFYLAEALRLADAATVSVDIERAETLRGWLLEKWPHPEILPAEVVQRAPIRALRESPAAKKALLMLVEHGWLEALPEGSEVRGAPRKLAYRIVQPGSR